VPQVEYADLAGLSAERVDEIKRRGCLVIRNVVDDAEATRWRHELEEFAKVNPAAEGKCCLRTPNSKQLTFYDRIS
jgi:hypothetical protein